MDRRLAEDGWGQEEARIQPCGFSHSSRLQVDQVDPARIEWLFLIFLAESEDQEPRWVTVRYYRGLLTIYGGVTFGFQCRNLSVPDWWVTACWMLRSWATPDLSTTSSAKMLGSLLPISNESDEGLTQGHSHDTGDRAAPNWTSQIGAKAEQHFVRKWFTWTGKKGWRPRLRCLAVCTWADILWGYHYHLLPFFLWGHWQDRRLQDRNIADLWCGGTGHKPHARGSSTVFSGHGDRWHQ